MDGVGRILDRPGHLGDALTARPRHLAGRSRYRIDPSQRVETQVQREFLGGADCDEMQGYLIEGRTRRVRHF